MFTTSRLRRSAVATALTTLCVGLAACGDSGSSNASTASSGSGSGSPSNAGDTGRVRLSECLREQGIDVPDNGQANPGAFRNVDREKLQDAMSGPCKEFQRGAFGDISTDDRQEFQDRFQKFAQCMRDAGVDLPDIRFDGSGPPRGLGQIDRNDPDFVAANETCSKFAPGGPGGAGFPGGRGAP